MDTKAVSDAAWFTEALTIDGGMVHLRPIRADDRDGLLRFYRSLPEHDIYLRFFSHHLPSDELLGRPTEKRTTDFTLVAVDAGGIVAVGGYIYSAVSQSAEVAFAVAAEHQHRGIGTLLLEHLAAHARSCGIYRFHAHTLPNNKNMLGVFLDAGYLVDAQPGRDETSVTFVLDDAADQAIATRDQLAMARSIHRLLHPKTIAVIGVSDAHDAPGHLLLDHLTASGFPGSLFGVGATAQRWGTVDIFPSVEGLPEPVDLAFIVGPADDVTERAESCGRAGVPTIVVLSRGFAEADHAGVARERLLLNIARRHGMRLVGPNSSGLAVNDAETHFHGTTSAWEMRRGSVGLATQSGALAAAVVAALAKSDVGVSSFVSLGNKADVSGNDLLQYWLTDLATDIGILHLESFGNPRKFASIARQFSRSKPLIVLQGATSAPAERTAGAHSSAEPIAAKLMAAHVVQDLCQDAGIIAVDRLSDLVDVVKLVAKQPIPRGNRIAILSDCAGPAILAADRCAAARLEIAPLTAGSGVGVEPAPPAIVIAPGDRFGTHLRQLLGDDDIDAVIAIFAGPGGASGVGAAFRQSAAEHPTKALVVSILATSEPAPIMPVELPSFAFPEQAITALGHATGLGVWRRSNPPQAKEPSLSASESRARFDPARQMVATVLRATDTAGAAASPGPILLDRRTRNALLRAVGFTMAGPDSLRPPNDARPWVCAHIDPVFGAVVTIAHATGDAGEIEHRSGALAPLTSSSASRLVDRAGVAAAARAAVIEVANLVGRLVDEVPGIAEVQLIVLDGGRIGTSDAVMYVAPPVRPRVVPRRSLARR